MLTEQHSNLAMAQRISCFNNLKQIGVAFRTWAIDHDGPFPFNLGTNAGGTMELCKTGADGFDSNAALHFQVMSNELSTPKLLVCTEDRSRQPAAEFHSLQASNVTYRLHSGTNLNEGNPTAVLALCPVDGNTLYCDGSVRAVKAPAWRGLMDVVRVYRNRLSSRCPVVLVMGLVLLWAGSRLRFEAKRAPRPLGVIIDAAMVLVLAVLLVGLALVATAHL
jgi:prepilin-type processing-associated H-X9-DG protein